MFSFPFVGNMISHIHEWYVILEVYVLLIKVIMHLFNRPPMFVLTPACPDVSYIKSGIDFYSGFRNNVKN